MGGLCPGSIWKVPWHAWTVQSIFELEIWAPNWVFSLSWGVLSNTPNCSPSQADKVCMPCCLYFLWHMHLFHEVELPHWAYLYNLQELWLGDARFWQSSAKSLCKDALIGWLQAISGISDRGDWVSAIFLWTNTAPTGHQQNILQGIILGLFLPVQAGHSCTCQGSPYTLMLHRVRNDDNSNG
jgi:hypothetical protein